MGRVLYLEPKGERSLNVAHAPEQREGFVEQKFTTYDVRDEGDSLS